MKTSPDLRPVWRENISSGYRRETGPYAMHPLVVLTLSAVGDLSPFRALESVQASC